MARVLFGRDELRLRCTTAAQSASSLWFGAEERCLGSADGAEAIPPVVFCLGGTSSASSLWFGAEDRCICSADGSRGVYKNTCFRFQVTVTILNLFSFYNTCASFDQSIPRT